MVFQCEQFVNEVKTTLTANVAAGATTITVASAAGFPSTAPYRIGVGTQTGAGQEMMLVTAGAGTTTWTVTRALEDTTAISHSSGSTVAIIFTQGSFSAFTECMFAADIRSERPSPEFQGRLYLTKSPGWYLYQDQVASWRTWGNIYQVFEPDNDDFSWINQNDTTAEQGQVYTSDGGIYITSPALTSAGEEVRMRKQDVSFEAPMAAPFKVTVAFVPILSHTDQTSCGIIFRDNSSEDFIFFRLMYDTTSSIAKNDLVISLDKYTDATTFDSNYKVLSSSTLLGSLIWFRMEDDTTDLIWSFSTDSKNFVEFDKRSRTDFLSSGPDEIGFGVNTNNTVGSAAMTLISWNKETA